MSTSDLPVVGTTVDARDVTGGVLETGLASGDVGIDYVLRVGNSLPTSGTSESAAGGLASVSEPGQLPVVLHGKELHELAAEDGMPDVNAETLGSGLVDAVHAGELPVSRITSNRGDIGGMTGELAGTRVYVHVQAGRTEHVPVFPQSTASTTADGTTAFAYSDRALEAGCSVGSFDNSLAASGGLKGLSFSRGHAFHISDAEVAEGALFQVLYEVDNVVEAGVVSNHNPTLGLNQLGEAGLGELVVVFDNDGVTVRVGTFDLLEVGKTTHGNEVLVVADHKSTVHLLDALETKEVLEGSVALNDEGIALHVGTDLRNLLEARKHGEGGVSRDRNATTDLALEAAEAHEVIESAVLGNGERLAGLVSTKPLNVLESVHVLETFVVRDADGTSEKTLESVKAVQVGQSVVSVDDQSVTVGVGTDVCKLLRVEIVELTVVADLDCALDLLEEDLGSLELLIAFDSDATCLVSEDDLLELRVVLHGDVATHLNLVKVGVGKLGVTLDDHVTLDNFDAIDAVHVLEVLVVGDVDSGAIRALHVVERLNGTNLAELVQVRRLRVNDGEVAKNLLTIHVEREVLDVAAHAYALLVSETPGAVGRQGQGQKR